MLPFLIVAASDPIFRLAQLALSGFAGHLVDIESALVQASNMSSNMTTLTMMTDGSEAVQVFGAGVPSYQQDPDGIPQIEFGPAAGVKMLPSVIFSVVFMILISFWYKNSITDRRPPWQGCPQQFTIQATQGRFKYDTFSCFDNTSYCLYGCCCLGARLADTYTTTNVGPGFWAFVLITYLCLTFSNLTGGVTSFVWVFFMAMKRKELRRTLGDLQADSGCAHDCVCYFFCACCTVIQEARQVDEATGTTVECCMKLNHVQQAPTVVGQPVEMAQSFNQQQQQPVAS